MRALFIPLLLASGLTLFSGCGTIRTEHVVKTQHEVQMDINVNLRVSRELNDFFGDLDAQADTLSAPAETTVE